MAKHTAKFNQNTFNKRRGQSVLQMNSSKLPSLNQNNTQSKFKVNSFSKRNHSSIQKPQVNLIQ